MMRSETITSGNTSPRAPRIAVGGFMLESNGHAPVSTREEFAANVLLEGEALLADLAGANPRSPTTLTGFTAAMSASGPWDCVPLIMAAVGASGPVDQPFFEWVIERLRLHLRNAGPLDGVFLSQHGAATATGDIDPDGTVFRAVREIVGPDVPIVATLDLHANVSQAMVDAADVLVAYRCNPHTDMPDRGADCARHLRAMLAGMKPHAAFVKLPFIPPSTSQNTKSGPYADVIAYGQSQVKDGVIDVSVSSGFTLGDTPKNGMSVIATATDPARAKAVARDVAAFAWSQRQRFIARLTPLNEATEMAIACGKDSNRPALLFADVADNPGGGGRGNTSYILAAFHKACVQGCAIGPVFDPELAAEAHRLGLGATFEARFNRSEATTFSEPFTAPGKVVALSNGIFVGRRGMAAGRTLDIGPSAVIAVDGIQVVVTTIRHQALDPMYFENFGIDIAGLRSLVVKSRGHFRAAFDEFFPDDRIIEVDVPGLTTPVLQNVPWRQVPRPIYPLDPEMQWSPP
ncbi:MAG: M81 family metallopeptidase [Ferrovibrio sp.]|uniref:M81 family metallopeptidase n=1 Tax=Ferrovibrio sp. TaxID=1917215 RepID=UPI00391DBA35